MTHNDNGASPADVPPPNGPRRPRDQVTAIDEALGRLDAGDYGVCARCGRPIGRERLAARPMARTCIACASRQR